MAKLVIPPRIGKVAHKSEGFNPYVKNIFSIDTETTGLDSWGRYGVDREVWPCRPFAFTMSDINGNTAYIRWQIDPRTRRVIPDDKSATWLQGLLCDKSLTKVFHNFQFDNHMLVNSGFKIRGTCHDTYIRQHVINPAEPSLGLKPLCDKYFNITDDDQKDLIKSVIKGRAKAKKNGWPRGPVPQADYALGDPDLCEIYAVQDAYRTMALYLLQEEFFDDNPALRAVYERERKLMHVIERMETRGVRIDINRTEEVKRYYEKYQEKSQAVIDRIAGKDFNPNSAPQKTKLFFGKLGHTPLEYSRKGKTKVYTDCQHCKGAGCKICQDTGRNPKCDGKFLETIAVERDEEGEVVKVKDKLAYNLLLNSAAQSMGNFSRQYLELAVQDEDGNFILHPNYRQAGPITGRFSCNNPNLQNVASDESGKKKVKIKYRPRECFIPRPGFMFYIPDFSQIEIWVLALLAKDKNMIDALAEGGDAHQIVADLAFPGAYDRTKADAGDAEELKKKKRCRKITKTLNFGIIYGQGDALTAESLNCTVAEAKRFKRQYFEIFPAVRMFMSAAIKKAESKGRVVNPYGREYPVPSGLEYRACNYLVQGTAAEVLKDGMVAVDKLSRTKYKGDMYQLLTIHDELMIEVRKSRHCKRTMLDVAKAMSVDYKFLGAPIPFPVGMAISETRWTETEEIKL